MEVELLEDEKFYRVCFISGQDEISLVRQEKLGPERYYPLSNPQKEVACYTVLESQKKFAGLSCGPVERVPYDTYRVKKVSFDVNTDWELAGFRYDIKNQIILYGTTALYIVKRDDKYYDVVTGREVPREIVGSLHPIFSVPDLKEMALHLETVRYRKPLYISLTEDMFTKLQKSHQNKALADQVYFQRMEVWNANCVCETDTDLQEYRKTIEEVETSIQTQRKNIQSLIKTIRAI